MRIDRISSAMVAAIGIGDVFSKGRDFDAWLGLVLHQCTAIVARSLRTLALGISQQCQNSCHKRYL